MVHLTILNIFITDTVTSMTICFTFCWAIHIFFNQAAKQLYHIFKKNWSPQMWLNKNLKQLNPTRPNPGRREKN